MVWCRQPQIGDGARPRQELVPVGTARRSRHEHFPCMRFMCRQTVCPSYKNVYVHHDLEAVEAPRFRRLNFSTELLN